MYDEAFTLSTGVTDAEVRYTTDGRDPLQTGQVLAGDLEITTTTVLRLWAGRDGVTHDTATATFLFPAHIEDQTPPDDWPTGWQASWDGGPFPADYEIDPDVVALDRDAWLAAFEAAPILSVVLPPESLFDPEIGIHENPKEEGADWERACNVEWFTHADSDGFNEGAGVRMQGGAGRLPDRVSKKSFRLLFKSDYGDTKLRYPVYGDGVEVFDTLVLRGRYNRSWTYHQESGRERAAYMRERYVADILRQDMGYLAPRARHAHLFLNGMYWGVFLVQERPEGDFMAQHLGGVEEDYDAINSGSVVDGDAEAWNELVAAVEAGFTTDEAWAWAQEHVDLVNLADYVLVETFFGNVDWPEKNFYAGRPKTGPWIWFAWDSELTMVSSTDDTMPDLVEGVPGQLFLGLAEQDDFKLLYADRIHRHLFDDGALTYDAIVGRWADLASQVEPVIPAESARWGDNRRDEWGDGDVVYTLEEWAAERDRNSRVYLETRTEKALANYEAGGWYPTLPAPEVVSTSPLELDVPGWAETYYTLDGTDPRLPGGELSPDALLYEGPVDSDGSGLFARAFTGSKWSASLEAD